MRPRYFAALVAARAVHVLADIPTAPRVLIGEEWRGIDGNWSAIGLRVGQFGVAEAKSYLYISTTLSETLVVGSGGCFTNDPVCSKYRGGPVDVFKSSTFKYLGTFDLGFERLGILANGDYGLDRILAMDSISGDMFALDQGLVAAYNMTEHYIGHFGLGINEAKLGNEQAIAPFAQMVQKYGWVPSYTYGYTAGAYYKNSGTQSSLTLGGYDANRFEPHDIDFTLARPSMFPVALVRGIQVSTVGGASKPNNWTSDTQVLSDMSDAFEVLFDSTTPYLWLPEEVCGAFEKAMGLTMNRTLDAYVVDADQFSQLKANSFSFTFSFSSYDNRDNFGSPLTVPGVVNITISSQAFAQVLSYPYKDETIRYLEQGVPYFPIKRSPDRNFTIGRTFMQEAYMITKYDSDTFSLHQAKFPANSNDVAIKAVQQPSNSRYPPPLMVGAQTGLSKSQMIGIVIGAMLVCIIGGLGLFCFCRHKRRARKSKSKDFADEDGKDTASSIIPETPRTPVARIFSKIIRRKKSRKAESIDATGTTANPAEVPNHELYELPVPPEPVELDADTQSLHSETELGTEGTENLSAYELARRKLERQLQGPVPAYSPPAAGEGSMGDSSTGEKTMQDVSPVETYRPSDQESPTSSPTYANSNSLPGSLPSPMSPHPDWTRGVPDLPSPLTMAPPFPSPMFATGGSGGSSTSSTGSSGPHSAPPISSRSQTFDPSSVARSNSATTRSPTSPAGSLVPPSPVFQRTPIDPSRVICLGPLPENVQLPSKPSLPRLTGPDGRSLALPSMSNHQARASTDTLGSNFTEVEERLVEEMTRQASQPSLRRGQTQRGTNARTTQRTLESPRSQERIDAGSELIHVPQMADRRYSWEEP